MKSNLENLNFQTSIREQVVPSRKKCLTQKNPIQQIQKIKNFLH